MEAATQTSRGTLETKHCMQGVETSAAQVTDCARISLELATAEGLERAAMFVLAPDRDLSPERRPRSPSRRYSAGRASSSVLHAPSCHTQLTALASWGWLSKPLGALCTRDEHSCGALRGAGGGCGAAVRPGRSALILWRVYQHPGLARPGARPASQVSKSEF